MDSLLGRKSDKARYENARSVLEGGSEKALKTLAKEAKTHPEMLYYLASNGAPDVRCLVAANASTPIQADAILAADELADVREAVAMKVGRLLPDLPSDARTDVGQKSLEILAQLASDELPRVRAIVAEAVKSAKHIPQDLAATLARDVETSVSAPILQYSPLLSDADLSEIIASGAQSGALDAIAQRANLSAGVSHDLVGTLDRSAIASLLGNDSAQIREDTLDAIIDAAPTEETWHAPLAGRSELSLRAMKRISGFIASYLVSEMVDRHELKGEAAEELLQAARAKINGESVDDALWDEWRASAEALYAQGQIDDALIRTYVKDNKRGLITHCLAICADISAK
ncbi:MAG: DUF2336 domain-containing protein, partial [Pseudomonadota bacterium]